MGKLFDHFEVPHFTYPRTFQYACIYSSIPLGLCSLAGLLAPGFLPPPSPSLSAEEIVSHYRHHEKGVLASAALLVWSSFFYLAFTIAISNQLQHIPNVHYTIKTLQLMAGLVSSITFLGMGLLLALAAYRLERNVEITQLLNDLFWLIFDMGAVPSYFAQYFAFGCSIMVDNNPKHPFPKAMGVSNIITAILFVPGSLAVHIVKTGPMAWDGAVSFWLPLVAWCIQVGIDIIYLTLAMFYEEH
ncbi:membrane protein [Annulohypoxylon moriforme]|nr:membrane protein [Annulohypoxylon moriforme]